MTRFTGHNTLLMKGDAASPEVFTKIAQVLSISGPSISRDTIDSTDADSTNDWRTFEASYIDGGEVTVEVNHDPDTATHGTTTGFLEDFGDTTLRNYLIRFATSPVTDWTFTATVTGVEPGNPHDGMSTASVTFKVTSKVTLA